ncbi:TadE/TadG family type IV pilus assembly protein [Devosia faecipullorum]|uniref:TadE/TadG family type IV pilus assembly protein n=1 Tax=Devosia faecipullorum TaxID=2755039 RepID=UPI00187B2938|nr:TadE/TadG family type IV pilus assembly protein [Devosia faecipullorum]MBE7734214.1 pilus assembly protein [Devosia faecipullorum]
MFARLRRIKQALQGFALAERGVAVIEFALILPIMLLVYLGSVEAGSLISTDRKVQAVAGAIGDLVARADKRLSTAQMQDYFRAASGIMTPYSPDPVLQVVTVIAVDNNGAATVSWSRQSVGGVYSGTTPHPPGSAYPLPAEMIAISKGQTVIASEASYSYVPLFGLIFNQPINLYRSSFYQPRFGGTITIN